MKTIATLFFTLFLVINLHSQIDMSTQTTIDAGLPLGIPLDNLNLLEPINTGVDSELLVKPEDKFSFGEEEQFANNGAQFDERLKKTFQKDGKMQAKFKSDQYLGDFRSNSGFVKIICRDYEYPDGDRVRVYVNDVVIQSNVLLEHNYKGFSIDLSSGFNKIDFEALNQGESGPNTAEFKVYDDAGQLVSQNQWNLATGVKATIIIVKE